MTAGSRPRRRGGEPATLAGARGRPGRRVHDAARREHRQRRGAVHATARWTPPPATCSGSLSGYALTFGLVLVPAGRFGDARGRRHRVRLRLALFTVASAARRACAEPDVAGRRPAAPGRRRRPGQPAGHRAHPGLFRGAERAGPFGLLGATIGISTAVGPLLGGLLIQLGGRSTAGGGSSSSTCRSARRGGARLAAAARAAPAAAGGPSGPTRPGRRGAARRRRCCCCCCRWCRAAVADRRRSGLLVPAGLPLLVAFGALGAGVRAARREPLVDLRLFGCRSYTLGALIALVYFAGFTARLLHLHPVPAERARLQRAAVAGLAITPFALGVRRRVRRSAAGSSTGIGRPLVAVGLVLWCSGWSATGVVLRAGVRAAGALGGRAAVAGRRHRQRPGDRPEPDAHPRPRCRCPAGAAAAARHAADRAAARLRGRHRRGRVGRSSPRWRPAAATGRRPSGTRCCWPPGSSRSRWSPRWSTSCAAATTPSADPSGVRGRSVFAPPSTPLAVTRVWGAGRVVMAAGRALPGVVWSAAARPKRWRRRQARVSSSMMAPAPTRPPPNFMGVPHAGTGDRAAEATLVRHSQLGGGDPVDSRPVAVMVSRPVPTACTTGEGAGRRVRREAQRRTRLVRHGRHGDGAAVTAAGRRRAGGRGSQRGPSRRCDGLVRTQAGTAEHDDSPRRSSAG